MFTEPDIEEHQKWVLGMLKKAASAAKDYTPMSKEWLYAAWQEFTSPKQSVEHPLPVRAMGTTEEVLCHIGKAISMYPNGLSPHWNLTRILSAREKTIDKGTNIDWAMAEALAFGSLVLEKNHVCFSGQDIKQGTFSQCHTVIHDLK